MPTQPYISRNPGDSITAEDWNALQTKIQDDIAKQVFLLNTFNYLVLYKMAVLLVCSPEAIKLLKCYIMWQ